MRGPISTISKVCLSSLSMQLSHLHLIRKRFKKSTVHICALRQSLSRFSSILSGVLALLWKSACSGIDLSFKTSLKLFSEFSTFFIIYSWIIIGLRGLAKCLMFKLLSANLFRSLKWGIPSSNGLLPLNLHWGVLCHRA